MGSMGEHTYTDDELDMVRTAKADGRGRVSLGADFADETVTVWVIRND